MIPCKSCRRHIRARESSCPFCRSTQHSVGQPASLLGALALANVFALTGCSNDRDPGDDELGGTSSESTMGSESTTDSTTSSGSESDVTDTEDSVDSLDDNGISFYAGPSPDFIQVRECDPFFQDCPDGEKCVPYASNGGNWDSNKCVPVTGIGQAGDPCTSGGLFDATDDCDGSSVCWNVMDVDGELVGECAALCGGTPDEPVCDPGSTCLITGFGSVAVCVDVCDPLLQDCGAGLGCFWIGPDFTCIFTTEDIPIGEPCSFLNDCAAGSYCTDAAALPVCNGDSCCTSYCDLADPICTLAGTECVSFFEVGMVPVGYEDIGICIVPP